MPIKINVKVIFMIDFNWYITWVYFILIAYNIYLILTIAKLSLNIYKNAF